MLGCNCGWQGMNLVSNEKDNTAHCPNCNEIFVDIPANRAVIISKELEKKITENAHRGIWTIQP